MNLLKNSALRYGLLAATIVEISQNPMGYKLVSFVALKLVENLAILQGITLSIISMSIFHMFKRKKKKKKKEKRKKKNIFISILLTIVDLGMSALISPTSRY